MDYRKFLKARIKAHRLFTRDTVAFHVNITIYIPKSLKQVGPSKKFKIAD
jgi:hypothetical protein